MFVGCRTVVMILAVVFVVMVLFCVATISHTRTFLT